MRPEPEPEPEPQKVIIDIINQSSIEDWLRWITINTPFIHEGVDYQFAKQKEFEKWFDGGPTNPTLTLTKFQFFQLYALSPTSRSFDYKGFFLHLVLIEALVTESEQKRSGLKYPLIETKKGMILMTPISWWRNFFYGE